MQQNVFIISLSCLFVSACTSSVNHEDVQTQAYQETYQTDALFQSNQRFPSEEDVTGDSDDATMNAQAMNALNTHYLIQVASYTHETYLSTVMKQLPENLPKWQNTKVLDDVTWHSLYVGDYTSQEEARLALKELPESIQEMNPFVKSVQAIKNSPYPELQSLR